MSSATVPVVGRAHTARVVARREFQLVRRGISAYAALAATLVVTGWFVSRDLDTLERNGLLVHADPFQRAFLVSIFLLALFLAISAVVSVARDRERGTLEVLFYGPIDEVAYVIGKLGGQIAAYVAALPVLLLALAVLSALTSFVVSGALLLSVVASVVPAAEIVAFGLVLSVLVTRVRTSILLFIGTTVLLIGVEFAATFISLIPIEDPSSALLPMRDALVQLSAVVDWISPFAYLERVTQNLATGAHSAAGTLVAASIALTLLLVALAAWGLRKRGVRRQES